MHAMKTKIKTAISSYCSLRRRYFSLFGCVSIYAINDSLLHLESEHFFFVVFFILLLYRMGWLQRNSRAILSPKHGWTTWTSFTHEDNSNELSPWFLVWCRLFGSQIVHWKKCRTLREPKKKKKHRICFPDDIFYGANETRRDDDDDVSSYQKWNGIESGAISATDYYYLYFFSFLFMLSCVYLHRCVPICEWQHVVLLFSFLYKQSRDAVLSLHS